MAHQSTDSVAIKAAFRACSLYALLASFVDPKPQTQEMVNVTVCIKKKINIIWNVLCTVFIFTRFALKKKSLVRNLNNSRIETALVHGVSMKKQHERKTASSRVRDFLSNTATHAH